jgi:hypothetical protein
MQDWKMAVIRTCEKNVAICLQFFLSNITAYSSENPHMARRKQTECQDAVVSTPALSSGRQDTTSSKISQANAGIKSLNK